MEIDTKVKLKTGGEVTLTEFYEIFIKELLNGKSLSVDEILYKLLEDTQENREAVKRELLKDLKREINVILLIKMVEG